MKQEKDFLLAQDIEIHRTQENATLSEKVDFLEKALQQAADKIRELRLREYQYYDILNNMTETVERDRPDFRINYVNNAYCTYFGVNKEEVIGTDGMEAIIGEDQGPIRALMKSLTPENPNYRYECRVRKSGGAIAWIEVVGCAFFNEEGNIIEYQDVVRDITHYIRTKDDLEEQVEKRTTELQDTNSRLKRLNHYLQNIVMNISESVVIIDKDGNVEILNKLPYGNSEEIKKELRRRINRAILSPYDSPIKRLAQQRERFVNAELNFSSSEGMLRFLASGLPLEDIPGQPSKSLLVLQSMTGVHHLVNRMSGAQAQFNFADILTSSHRMQEVIHFAKIAAKGDCNILIEGESGTGKEMFAQAIHNDGPQANGPFIAVNCGAIPRELVASELFGYAEGAFTGAKKGGKPGKFELADGGTLFLDEIGDMPLEQQIALLRVIQERKCTRVGGDKDIPVNIRLICATNKNLGQEVADGNFRQDLYFRLNVITLQVPPLRERKNDILLLFHYFLKRYDTHKHHDLNNVDASLLDILLKYPWPGNVRELQNITERMVYLAGDRQISSIELLPNYFFTNLKKSAPPANTEGENKPITMMEQHKQIKKDKIETEKALLFNMLERCDNNISKTAKEMGISRTAVYRRLKKYRIEL